MCLAFEMPCSEEGLLGASREAEALSALVSIMRRLLAEDGCPWDREQTFESLRPYVLEEACEVMDAIDSQSRAQLCEELGDLTLQVVFLSELATKEGSFGLHNVIEGISEKLVRRHPHVFGNVEVSGSQDVVDNWDAIKRQEKANRPLLGGVPRALPALLRANTISDRVSKVGFDWPDREGSRSKVAEELREFDVAARQGDPQRMEDELGDVLFALVNLARHHGIDPERALQRTSDRFSQRFAFVEARVRRNFGDWPKDEKGRPTAGLALKELDRYWDEAKSVEAAHDGNTE